MSGSGIAGATLVLTSEFMSTDRAFSYGSWKKGSAWRNSVDLIGLPISLECSASQIQDRIVQWACFFDAFVCDTSSFHI